VTGSGTAAITDSNSIAGCTNVTTCLADVGDSITITPTASTGNRFTGWSGGTCAGTANPCTLPAPSSNETDTANFAKTDTITATAVTTEGPSGGGAVTITDSDAVAGCTSVTSCLADVGDSVTLTPVAASGYRFTGWSGGTCTGTTSPCKLTTTATAESDTASFAETVTLEAGATGPARSH